MGESCLPGCNNKRYDTYNVCTYMYIYIYKCSSVRGIGMCSSKAIIMMVSTNEYRIYRNIENAVYEDANDGRIYFCVGKPEGVT